MKSFKESKKNTSEVRELSPVNEEKKTFGKYIGIEITQAADGHAKGRMKVEEFTHNAGGTVHGGALFTLADSVAGSAAFSLKSRVATLDAAVHFLRPGRKTDYIYGQANVIKSGSTVLVIDVKLTDDRDNLLFSGTFSFYVFKEKREK